MTENFVDSIIDKIISDCYDYLKDQVGGQTAMEEELEKLRVYSPHIRAVVRFASSQEQIRDKNHILNEWLWQLRNAIDGAHDVLDEHKWLKHEKQLTKKTEETKKRKFMSFSFLFESPRKIIKICEHFLKRDPILKRLEKAVQELDKVSAGVTTFLHLLDSAKQEVDSYKTHETGFLPKNDLIGRRREKELVMEWLRSPSNEPLETNLYKNISLLFIVGHGGMGKTTLLQHVYNDEITREFDLKMWVCVSNNFDVRKVIADMLEALEINRHPLESIDALQKTERPHLASLTALQNLLMIAVRSKKFLLILDDIWEEEENPDISKWGNVLAPLAYGGLGSKIMVTTRMDSVAKMIEKVITKKTVIFPLKGLEEEDCLELLKYHAFSGVENANGHNIIRDIVKKLSGYPLAAKVIGGIIKSNLNEGRWMTILERNSSIISLGENYIYSVLKPSYISLSNPLRNCFAFCCLFPHDYLFDKDGLVRMWIALDFIQPPDDQIYTMEDIGGRYFDDLVQKSFFDKVEGLGCYKMHVLFYELASKISAQECSKVLDYEKPSLEISKTRHLYVQTLNPDILRKIKKLKYLRSLFLSYEASNQDFFNALIEIFKESRSLRLLHICTPRSLEMIPDDIGNLKHLRYLKIYGWNLIMLPRSVRNLYHLQYIIYEGPSCFDQPQVDEFLPSDINNLCNLRYLILPLNYVSSIHEIGKLKSLQELDVFDFRNVNGYRIGELKYMNDLRKLRINHLENVDVQEAQSANLRDKRRLADLTLDWNFTNSRNNDLDEDVLDNLQPQDYCLRNLSIRNYMGARSANWMTDVNRIRKLVKIELINCEKWETLPPFGQLRFLKSLELCNMPKVNLLENTFSGNGEPCVFQSLKVLRIERLEALEDWFEAGIAVEDGRLFPCLIELVLKDCPVLKELPYLPSELKSLEIENIGWTNLEFCSFSNSIPLETLKVCDCQNIASLPLADEIARLEALRNLAIKNCPNLISLAKLPDRIISDPSESLSSLQEQSINEVSMLRESPNLPPSLKDLSISNCHPELFARYRNGGSDRHNIAHIPNIHIDP